MRDYRRLTIPKSAHPLVRELYVEMNKQQVSPIDVASRAGLNVGTLVRWRTRNSPKLEAIEAAYNVLGKRLVIQNLPDEWGMTDAEARKHRV